jgi:hypothetical protein
MAEVHPTPSHAGKVGNFLSQSTAGLPNWVWLLIVGGGILAAIYIPKLLPGAKTTTDTSGTGLGLAIDPTTGLPYAVEGLVPSGGNAGGTTGGSTGTVPSSPTAGTGLISAFTRDLQPGAAPPNTIPIWKTPNVDWNATVGGIPINTAVQIGTPVKTGNQVFYPITYNGITGFVGAWDLAGIPTSNVSRVSWPYAQGVG